MRILLDENLDRRLSRRPPGHEVKSVTLRGWAGTKNGALLARAAGQFDVPVTMDSAMVAENRQALENLSLAVVALRARSSRLADTSPLMVRLPAHLPTLPPGQVVLLD